MREEDFFPRWSPPPTKKHRKRPEAQVQKDIIQVLLAFGAILAVTDAGILNRLGLNMICGIPAGWPDLTVCLPGGRFLGVECKAPGGRQSPDQLAFQRRIENSGGAYILASSVAEFQIKFRLVLDKV